MADKDEVDSTEESGEAVDPLTDGNRDAAEPEDLVDGEDGLDASPADDEPTEGERELVTVGAPAKDQLAGAEDDSAPVARGRQKKDKATPRQKQAVDKDRRTGPVTFLKESVSELQKVVYPTGNQLVNYFIVVLIFVLFIIAIVSLLDLAFGKAIIAIFS